MKRVVVDASYLGGLVFQDECSEEAEKLLEEALTPGGPLLLAPSLWTYEMINLLKTAVKRNRLTLSQAEQGFRLLEQIPIQLVEPLGGDVRRRIFEISIRYDLSAYDASYFELADRLDLELRSHDKQLVAAYTSRNRGGRGI